MNIVELTRNTATNMQELLLRLADHIAMIEAENVELKAKLEAHNDDLK
jgi:hypothetical protein